jgi:hypothetical protein
MTQKQIAKELYNLSGELLSRSEFKEYIKDYYNNPSDYSIDEDSDYYEAISYAYNNLDQAYHIYDLEFEDKFTSRINTYKYFLTK